MKTGVPLRLAPRRLGSGMTNKAWAFRKRAALDPSQDFAQRQLFVYSSSFPSHFLFFHLLPLSGCLLHPAGGEVGGGRWLLSNRPPSQSRLLWWVLCQGDCLTHIRGSEAGAAWEDGLRNPRHPAPGECWAPLLPAGGSAWAASKQGFACRVGQQLLTSLGLRSGRRGPLKVHKNQS